MKIHDFITISRSKDLNDGSYSRDVWEVIAINETHVQVESVSNYGSFKGPHILLRKSYDFTDATDFITIPEEVGNQ